MSIKLFHTYLYTLFITFISAANVCNASDAHLNDLHPTSSGQSTPAESHARFHANTAFVDGGEDNDETPTEVGHSSVPNNTFAAHTTIVEEPLKESEKEEDGFISVDVQAKVKPTLRILGGMFDTLILPHSSMPYTEIDLSHCTCFNLLDPSSFQYNPELERIVFSKSQFNLRYFEEKLGEKCPKLSYIDLQGFVDVSVTEQPIITPERFAQIAHPDLLQRILAENCTVLISTPDQTGCYRLDDMKERFLSSILQLRSLAMAKETLSTYQVLIDMLTAGASKLDPTQLAAAGGRVLLGVYTGI